MAAGAADWEAVGAGGKAAALPLTNGMHVLTYRDKDLASSTIFSEGISLKVS